MNESVPTVTETGPPSLIDEAGYIVAMLADPAQVVGTNLPETEARLLAKHLAVLHDAEFGVFRLYAKVSAVRVEISEKP